MEILIVEDDHGVRDSFAAIIREEGYDVVEASSGEEALEILERDPLPALILLDLMMPRMDGETFRAQQLRNPRLAGIPLIVISARPDVKKVATGIGVVDVLRKPMSFEALIELVHERAGHPASSVFTLESAHDLLKPR